MCYCLQDYDSFEKFPIKDDRISHLLPACYQDMIVRVYTRKSELVSEIQPAFLLLCAYFPFYYLLLCLKQTSTLQTSISLRSGKRITFKVKKIKIYTEYCICFCNVGNILQVEAVSEAFENFQMKTYGKKTQVHATPEKKKRLKY